MAIFGPRSPRDAEVRDAKARSGIKVPCKLLRLHVLPFLQVFGAPFSLCWAHLRWASAHVRLLWYLGRTSSVEWFWVAGASILAGIFFHFSSCLWWIQWFVAFYDEKKIVFGHFIRFCPFKSLMAFYHERAAFYHEKRPFLAILSDFGVFSHLWLRKSNRWLRITVKRVKTGF